MKAIGKNIIVEKLESETTSTSGIIYTDNSKVTLGKVISVGEEVTSVKDHDKIILNWSAAVPVKIDHQYYIVNVENVYAIK